jgi:succinyl-diaminopimelate desuccinylase
MCYREILSKHKHASLGLLLTTDEEIGGFNGTRYVVESGLKPNILFLPDGGNNFNIIVSEKAPHHFVVEAKGEAGHASRAFELNNPINRIVNFYTEARTEFNSANSQKTWASTFEMTTIETDNKAKNRIPSMASASFSWRWPLEQIKFHNGRERILTIAKKHNCNIVLEEGWGEGTVVDKNDQYIKDWQKIIELHIGRKISFVQSHGASDARHFYNSKKYGTKNIIITSALTGGLHSNSEWVDVESLNTMIKSLMQYIENKTV